jgi:hypothetical protein
MTSAVEELDLRPLKEAAAYARVHEDTVRRWVRLELIHGYGTPGRRLIDWPELVEFVHRGPTKHPIPPRTVKPPAE